MKITVTYEQEVEPEIALWAVCNIIERQLRPAPQISINLTKEDVTKEIIDILEIYGTGDPGRSGLSDDCEHTIDQFIDNYISSTGRVILRHSNTPGVKINLTMEQIIYKLVSLYDPAAWTADEIQDLRDRFQE
jgi:hypothetical protein